MVAHSYSGQKEFEEYYDQYHGGLKGYFRQDIRDANLMGAATLGRDWYLEFVSCFMAARALVLAVKAEILSRELPIKTELSYEVAVIEFDTAQQMLNESNGEEVFIRASGMIARVALERHLLTVADARSLTIIMNPASKRHPDASDVINTLSRAGVITAVQKSQLESLFAVANNCAHPKGPAVETDVDRLIHEGKQLAAVIV